MSRARNRTSKTRRWISFARTDRAREGQVSVAKIGTTGRGIGPCYEDKVGRRVIRVADLADTATLELRVDRALLHHNPLRKGLGLEPVDRADLLVQLRQEGSSLNVSMHADWIDVNDGLDTFG